MLVLTALSDRGDRLWRDHMVNSPNVVKMTWDELNRMKSVQGTQDGSVNFYRADGLRARRVTGIGIGFNVDDQGAVSGYYDTYSLDRPTWRYYHDGQAPFEDDVTYDPGSGARKDVTRYALGARGGDMAETVLAMGSSGERTVRSYPLYDGHGNTVGQVARAEDDAPGGSFVAVPGAPAFELGARRKYDAWGQVRWSEGSPLDQGYCGSLQHRRDAESGLVYMRVRYYEPWTGRFLSEDPAMDGANWYVYCANDPVNLFDPDGLADHSTSGWYQFHMIMGMGYFSLAAILAVVDGWAGVYLSKVERLVKIGALILASYHLSAAVSETGRDEGSLATFLQGMEAYAGTIAMIGEAMGSSKARGFGMVAELAMAAYTLLLIGLLLRIDE